MTHSTIEQAMQTNHPVTIIGQKLHAYMGCTCWIITAMKKYGKKEYFVIQYENGTFSTAITR